MRLSELWVSDSLVLKKKQMPMHMPAGKGRERSMQDRIYLLSLQKAGAPQKEISDSAEYPLLAQMLEKSDRERIVRASRIQSRKKQLESVGAGLLLQLAVQEALKEKKLEESSFLRPEAMEGSPGESRIPVILLTIPELLDRVQKPLNLQYRYGAAGKPYFKNEPYFFSLSHSGEYVMCGISEEEIGADIQQIRECNVEKTAERFFSEEEKRRLADCAGSAEKQAFFFELWVCKEAYGKLTGQGISEAVRMDMSRYTGAEANFLLETEGRLVRMEKIKVEGAYKAAVCRYVSSMGKSIAGVI